MVLARTIFIGLFLSILLPVGISQNVLINEVMSSNQQYLYDSDGDSPDWIELWNNSTETIDLSTYSIDDDSDTTNAWHFPSFSLAPDQYLLLFASGKDRSENLLYWETIISEGDTWEYIIPSSEVIYDWRSPGFEGSTWSTGESGFGYGDNDDNTIVPNSTISVFMRKTFNIANKDLVKDAFLHMDYDDAFVAYLNGTEIARANISSDGPPAYYATANTSAHEAKMYQGGSPEPFQIHDIGSLLLNGENVLAIQSHNVSTGSSDLTAIPFLTLGYSSTVTGSVHELIDLPEVKFHTNFSISSAGESIYLFKNDQITDSLQVDSLPSNYSFGRNITNPAELNYFTEPTPEAPNTSQGYTSLTGEVKFSISGGIKYTGFRVALSSDNSNDNIYFTLDNTEPGTESSRYMGPITINSSGAIRARIINEGGMPGPVCTESYLLYIDHDLPVISLVTDPDNFFSNESGIYVNGSGHPSSGENCDNGQNWWQNWERPVYATMFDANGNKKFGQNAGVKIFGGCSRNFSQKSLSLRFRKSYGQDGLDYKVFDNIDPDRFYSLNLRSSGNDWNQTMMKDAYASKFFPDQIDKQAYQPAVLYLNGEYWGIHNIRERFDEDYYATHYGLDASSVNIMEFHVNWLLNLVEGDGQPYLNMLEFIGNNDLTIQENYDTVKSQLDVENFALYQAANIAVKNTDWPGNNVKFWQCDDYDPKWRWMTYDLDFGFSDVNHNTLLFALADNNTGWPNPAESTYLLRMLNTNQEFQHLFINSFADILNTKWKADYYEPIFNEMKSTISSEIPKHMERWGGNASGWSSRADYMKTFSAQRPAVVKNFVRNLYGIDGMYTLNLQVNDENQGSIKVNSVDLKNYTNPWQGQYFNDIPVQLVAKPKKGYKFRFWAGEFTSFNDTVSLTSDKTSSMRAYFEPLPNYEEIIVINEVFYNNVGVNQASPEDWVEIYNKGENEVDVSNWILKDDNDNHSFIIPQETVIPANDYLLICRDTRAVLDHYGYLISTVGDFNFGFSSDGDCVRLYDNNEILVDSLAYTNPDPNNDYAFSYQRIEEDGTTQWYITDNYGTPGKENNIVYTSPDIPSFERLAGMRTFPNPFRNHLNIEFELQAESFVSIYIISQEGKYISQIEDGTLKAGSHAIEWKEAANLPKGLYLISIETEFTRSTQKVIKL